MPRLSAPSVVAHTVALAAALAFSHPVRAQAGVQASVQASPAAGPAIDPAAARVLALEAPAQVGSYARVGRRDFGTPTLGVGYTYANPADSGQVRLSAYFYERDPEARGLPAAAAVARQADLFRQALAVEQRQGVLEAYQVALEGADSVPLGAGRSAVPGFHMYVAQRRGGRVYLSFFGVYAVGDGFIKVRCTVPEAGWERRDLQGVAKALVWRTLAGA